MKSRGGKIIKPLKIFMIVRIESRNYRGIKSRNSYFFNLVRSINLYFLLPFFISKSILFQHISSSFICMDVENGNGSFVYSLKVTVL